MMISYHCTIQTHLSLLLVYSQTFIVNTAFIVELIKCKPKDSTSCLWTNFRAAHSSWNLTEGDSKLTVQACLYFTEYSSSISDSTVDIQKRHQNSRKVTETSLKILQVINSACVTSHVKFHNFTLQIITDTRAVCVSCVNKCVCL